jgi:hypothetical protein
MSSSSYLRRAISRLVVPNLDRDLTQTLNRHLAAAHNMTDCFLSPAVYAYESRPANGGAFNATSMAQQRGDGALVKKVHYPIPSNRGLFQ